MWFEELTGFNETSPQQARNNLSVDGGVLKSLAAIAISPGASQGSGSGISDSRHCP